jgi:hypothetical protein
LLLTWVGTMKKDSRCVEHQGEAAHLRRAYAVWKRVLRARFRVTCRVRLGTYSFLLDALVSLLTSLASRALMAAP